MVTVEKSNLIMQGVCMALILAACFFLRPLMWLAGIIAFAYIFSEAKWEQKIAFFMFLLFFTPIFRVEGSGTTLFMFLKLGVVACYMFKEKEKLNSIFIISIILFFTYSMILSEIYETEYLTKLVNIVLWTLVGYVIARTLTTTKTTPVVKSFSNGAIITGVIGLFVEKIPQLQKMVVVEKMIAADGAYVFRAAGLWSDPNYFTILVIAALWFIYYEFNFKRVSITEFLTRNIVVSFIGLMTLSKSCVLLLVIFWAYVLLSKNDIKTAPKVILFFALLFATMFFLYKNPYWISDMVYRFMGTSNELDATTFTTSRNDIWSNRLNELLENTSWIFGNGLENKGSAHNTLIQMVYTLGLVGTCVYLFMLRMMYIAAKKSKVRKNPCIGKSLFISLLISAFLLDGLYMELYYYVFPLAFVYMANEQEADELPE